MVSLKTMSYTFDGQPMGTPLFWLAHPQHPLRRPQVMDGVIGHELGDHLLAPRPGVGAPPSWSARPAHGEGDLLRRVVGPDSANHTPTEHSQSTITE